MSLDLAPGTPTPADDLAGTLKRTELQRHPLSVPGREVDQPLASFTR